MAVGSSGDTSAEIGEAARRKPQGETGAITFSAYPEVMPSETALALDAFFEPRSVAVIGATEAPGSIGLTLLTNLAATPFGGTAYPVNPMRSTVLGVKAYPRIADVRGKVDL